MKNRPKKTFTVLLLCGLCLLSACAAKGPGEFTSTDGAFTVSADTSFTDMSGRLNDDSVLEIGNERQEKYFMLITYESAYFVSADEFYNYFVQYELSDLFTSYEQVEEAALSTGSGNEIRKLSLRTVYDGEEMLMNLYFTAVGDVYVLGCGWCPYSAAEKYASQLDSIAASIEPAGSVE